MAAAQRKQATTLHAFEEEFNPKGGASMSYRVYAPTLATLLLIGTIGTALAQTKVVDADGQLLAYILLA